MTETKDLSHVGQEPSHNIKSTYGSLIFQVFYLQASEGLDARAAINRVDGITPRVWYYHRREYPEWFASIQADAAGKVIQSIGDAGHVTFLAKAQAQVKAEQEILLRLPELIQALLNDAVEGDAKTRLDVFKVLRQAVREGILLSIPVPRGTTETEAAQFEEKLKALPLDLLDVEAITLTDGQVVSFADGATVDTDRDTDVG